MPERERVASENIAGPRRRRSALIVKTVLSAIAVPGALTVGVPYVLVAGGFEVHGFDAGALRMAGVALAVASVAVLALCSAGFVVVGDGTPNPADPPRFLVARGIYRVVRNPMYVAMGATVLGEALFWGSTTLLLYLALLMVGFHVFVTAYEEPTLTRLFAESYDRYRAEVPRWIPRWR